MIDNETMMPGVSWFLGSSLNFAENLLRYRDDQAAIIFKCEVATTMITITYKEVYEKVRNLAHRLRKWGLKPGDRVAAYTPNIPDTIIAMLATTRYFV